MRQLFAITYYDCSNMQNIEKMLNKYVEIINYSAGHGVPTHIEIKQ